MILNSCRSVYWNWSINRSIAVVNIFHQHLYYQRQFDNLRHCDSAFYDRECFFSVRNSHVSTIRDMFSLSVKKCKSKFADKTFRRRFSELRVFLLSVQLCSSLFQFFSIFTKQKFAYLALTFLKPNFLNRKIIMKERNVKIKKDTTWFAWHSI